MYRLGDVEKAIYHYKHAGLEADQDDIAKARTVQTHLNKCTEAKRRRDWNSLLKESDSAINDGADSAPQVTYILSKFSNIMISCINFIYNFAFLVLLRYLH